MGPIHFVRSILVVVERARQLRGGKRLCVTHRCGTSLMMDDDGSGLIDTRMLLVILAVFDRNT